jgi:folate-dependent tRNA-U54 methylase TrmFO/GidA
MTRYEKRRKQYIQNKMFKEETKQFCRYLGAVQQSTTTHIWKKLSFTGNHYGKKKCNRVKRQIG